MSYKRSICNNIFWWICFSSSKGVYNVLAGTNVHVYIHVLLVLASPLTRTATRCGPRRRRRRTRRRGWPRRDESRRQATSLLVPPLCKGTGPGPPGTAHTHRRETGLETRQKATPILRETTPATGHTPHHSREKATIEGHSSYSLTAYLFPSPSLLSRCLLLPYWTR